MALKDRKIRILAIDDEAVYLHAIVGLLSESYKIIIALNGREGLKIADVDPRGDRTACDNISDKARLVGAGAELRSFALCRIDGGGGHRTLPDW